MVEQCIILHHRAEQRCSRGVYVWNSIIVWHSMEYRVTQKKRAPILIILNTRGPFFLSHPVHAETHISYCSKCPEAHWS